MRADPVIYCCSCCSTLSTHSTAMASRCRAMGTILGSYGGSPQDLQLCVSHYNVRVTIESVPRSQGGIPGGTHYVPGKDRRGTVAPSSTCDHQQRRGRSCNGKARRSCLRECAGDWPSRTQKSAAAPADHRDFSANVSRARV